MRSILSLSLSPALLKEIDRGVQATKCSSRSEFLRQLVREWLEKRAIVPKRKRVAVKRRVSKKRAKR